MYFRGWLHSWVCRNCPYADVYWGLRAYWAGVKHKRSADSPPKRCPSAFWWEMMWIDGYDSAEDELGLEF